MSLKVALVGYGYWGPNLARNFHACPGTSLAMICDQSENRRSIASKSFPETQVVSDFSDVLSNPEIDTVVIATPTATHYPIARAALLANKHVFIEKPLTDSIATSKELVDLARNSNLTLHVDHTFVYTGAVRYLEQMVSKGELGSLLYFDSTRVNLGLFQPDVNVLWDLAVHDLSILQFITKRQVISVSATGTRHPDASHESAAFMTLFYDDLFVAHVGVSWLSPVKIRRTLISGTKKMAVYDDLDATEKLRIYDSGVDISQDPDSIRQALVSYRTGDMVSPKISGHEALAFEVDHFVTSVNQGSASETDGEMGLNIVRILEAASESLAKNGTPIYVMKD